MNQLVPMEVGICCQNLDALKRFYVEELGLTEINVIDVPAGKAGDTGLTVGAYRVVRLQTPFGERIKLLQPEKESAAPTHTATILDRCGNAYLTFIVDDLAAMLAKLKKLGLPLLSGDELVEVRPGTFLIFLRDPEGNILEFVQYANIQAYRPDVSQES